MRYGGTWWRDLRDTLGARHEPGQIHVLADLYWRTLLMTAFITSILVFLYSTWGLLRILNDLGSAIKTTVLSPPALNRAELDATIRAFEERKTQFENLKTNPPAAIADPSR